jgi:predicted nicotinamide N-methyase
MKRASIPDLAGALRPFGHPLALRRLPLCPEISLWLIDGPLDLEAACDTLAEDEPPPFWAFCWGSGQGLARYVLDHPEEVAGRSVVDFGAGTGVVGIAAALAGAESVTAVDLDPRALAAARCNASSNRVALETAERAPRRWDVVLASDVVYEAEARSYLEAQSLAGRSVLLSEPHRPGMPRWEGKPLARYEARTLPDVDSPTTEASVHRLGGVDSRGQRLATPPRRVSERRSARLPR